MTTRAQTIANRSQNFAFKISIFKILFILCVSLCPPWSAKASWRRRRWQKNLLNPWLKLVLISVHSWFNFVPFVYFVVKLPKMKANPFQTHPNPFFHTKIFDSSEKMRIFDKFRTTFLCKAKPF